MRIRLFVCLALAAISVISAQPAVKAGGFIYASGTSGVAGGKGNIKGQTKVALDTLSASLKAAGSSFDNACLVTVYLRNASDFAAMGEVYATYFPKDPPARVTVIVDGLPATDALVQISMIAVPAGAERKVLKPKEWSNSPLPYSYGIQIGNTVFLAGLVSRNSIDNSNVKGDVTAQTHYIMGNAAAILKEANMTLDDVAQSRVYLTDTANFQAMNAAYRPAFTAAPPARATIRTGLTSPDYLVEIAMIAVKDPSRTAINPPGPDGKAVPVNPNFSAAIRVENRLFVAGMAGDTTEVMARIEQTMTSAGFSLSDAVEGMAYVVDPSKISQVNAAYRDALGKILPASTSVGVGLVAPGADGEISFIAQK